MATRNITTKIQLDGEKEYKNAVSEINSGMRVLRSEMELAKAKFSDNTKSMEALTARGDILERQILSQKDKISVLKDALSESAKQYGESDKRTQNWQVSLNKAEAELQRMNGELDENREAQAQTQQATDETALSFEAFEGESKGLGDALASVSSKLGIELPQGLQSSLNGIVKISPKVLALAAAFAAVGKAVIDAEKKLMEWTGESAKFADDMLTTSLVTGISTEALQEWSYSAELMDVSIDTVQSSLARLTRSMSDAREGTGKAKDTFGELGVAITDADGTLRDSEEVFWDVIDTLGSIGSVSERDAAAMEIFGRSAQDLNPLIINGREAFEGFAEEAHKAGAVLSGEGLDALGAVDDAQQRLLQTQEAVTKQISTEYAPYMKDSLTMSRKLVDDLGKALVDSGAVQAFGSILTSVQSLAEPLVALGRDILPPFASVLKGVATTMAWIADTANAVIGILTLNPTRYSTAMGSNPYAASNMQKVQYGATYKTEDYGGNVYNPTTGRYEGNYFPVSTTYGGSGHFASGGISSGGYAWVGEAGPERVYLPAGSRVLSAQESRNTGNTYVNLYVDHINDLQQLIEIVNSARIKGRMGGGN